MERSLIKLELEPSLADLTAVRQLKGLQNLQIDDGYGLVCISPKRRLYVIRVIGAVDADRLQAAQPRIRGLYGEVRVSQSGEERDGRV